jgi:hypothetical protein
MSDTRGIALHCPAGTRPVRDEDLVAGDAVYVPGLGAFPVRSVWAGGPTRRLAVLAWGDLALVLHPGTVRRCLPRPGAT